MFSPAKQKRMDELLEKNSDGTITPSEKARLEGLVAEAEQWMVTNAKLLANFARDESAQITDIILRFYREGELGKLDAVGNDGCGLKLRKLAPLMARHRGRKYRMCPPPHSVSRLRCIRAIRTRRGLCPASAMSVGFRSMGRWS